MYFFEDVYVTCHECEGRRYRPDVLQVTYQGRDISQVLQMTVDEAIAFFAAEPVLTRRLQVLQEVGLGYLRLGQPATTLSGGEAQRLKIAAELSARLDRRPPLHPRRADHRAPPRRRHASSSTCSNRLVDAGNTVLVVEHHLDVIKSADWIIDLGPEGGDAGGELVAEGTPEAIAQVAGSYTGKYLRELLPRPSARAASGWVMDYHHLLEATGTVGRGLLFYSLAYGWFAPDDPRRRPLWTAAMGLVWGGLAVILMISRIQTTDGVFVDGRVVPVALIGLFEGGWAGLVAALAASAYRIWLGGSGAAAGVITLLAVAAAAALVHRWAAVAEKVRFRHAFVLSVATFFITFGGFGLLGERGRTLFARVWPSYLALIAIGIPALAMLMASIVERRALAQERERFRAVLDDATDAVRVVDVATQRIIDCNRADCDLSGLAAAAGGP